MTDVCSKDAVLGPLIPFSVFLYFSLMFAVPSGYSYGAALLLLGGLYFLARRPSLLLSRDDRAIIYAFFAVFLVSLFAVIVHGDGYKTLDQTSRFLFAIPILLLLLKLPPTLPTMWSGVVIGIVLSNGIAVWQLHWENEDRASGFLNIIHFGNIGLVFGILCVTGMLWAGTQGRYANRWRAAFVLGVLASIYAVIASGSRGSWLAIPPVLLIFLAAFLTKRNLKHVIGALAALVVTVGVVFSVPETGVEDRYDLAVTEVNKYLDEKYVFENEQVSSVGARLEIWRTAFINIPQKPLLGWGDAEYQVQLKHQVARGEIDPYMLQMANAHNNYLEVWIYQGLPGLLALLAVYFIPLWLFCKRIRSHDITVKALALSGAGLVASYSMFSMSQVILGRNNGVIFYALTLVILWACMREAERKAPPASP
ncbi:MAG TPA: O-antigen ligase family protein [Burkholderiaceae bacterium]|nr:O-antigen ligase family protein [Burkholderiaceae bacterium]